MCGKNGFWNIRKCGFATMTQKSKDIPSALPVDPAGVAESVELKGVIRRPMNPSEGATKI
jgi:hypothetical protein